VEDKKRVAGAADKKPPVRWERNAKLHAPGTDPLAYMTVKKRKVSRSLGAAGTRKEYKWRSGFPRSKKGA